MKKIITDIKSIQLQHAFGEHLWDDVPVMALKAMAIQNDRRASIGDWFFVAYYKCLYCNECKLYDSSAFKYNITIGGVTLDLFNFKIHIVTKIKGIDRRDDRTDHFVFLKREQRAYWKTEERFDYYRKEVEEMFARDYLNFLFPDEDTFKSRGLKRLGNVIQNGKLKAFKVP